MSFQPSDKLLSRTYLGLIISQFLAAFNDQCIAIVAIFYAGDMLIRHAGVNVGDNTIISIVAASFILPFALFSTLAGMLADRFSKRSILVFWKAAEVAITGLILFGFLLPHLHAFGWVDKGTLAIWSACLVASGVFLMGTHSAFFIPAKYGVMPEILQPTVLSKGNGWLEGTSFVANILGTAFGAFLYGQVKSYPTPDGFEVGHEWIIGLVLFGLAWIGAVFSFLIERMPPAAPGRPLTWMLWKPLWANVSVLLRSRPLALSVIGIAFFTFLTLYSRQALLYDGEAKKDLADARQLQKLEGEKAAHHQHPAGNGANGPEAAGPAAEEELPLPHTGTRSQQQELKVALLIAFIGLGIGFGSPLAGFLSGKKVELGLVPIGNLFLILFTFVLSFLTKSYSAMIVCLVLIGVAAGLYIVPLYSLLQHRAPKDSKGNLVATSNFVNVVGGLLAIGVFWAITTILEATKGLNSISEAAARSGTPELLDQYVKQFEAKVGLTRILFLAASFMCAILMLVLGQQLPDFFVRTLLWLRSLKRYHLQIIGANNLPSEGPVILATNCERTESCMQVLSATDRFIRFILPESSRTDRLPIVLRFLTKRVHLAVFEPGHVNDQLLQKTLAEAVEVLKRGEMVGLPADSNGLLFEVEKFLHSLRERMPAKVLPVFCGSNTAAPPGANGRKADPKRIYVVIGEPVPPEATAKDICDKIHRLGEWIRQLEQGGKFDPPTVEIPKA
jgi:acyl-[acyl-carrier-protein]-phospholipid O-acyltransferase/long-chain-fatty-acid--[acyl-carrier-protein] ligase